MRGISNGSRVAKRKFLGAWQSPFGVKDAKSNDPLILPSIALPSMSSNESIPIRARPKVAAILIGCGVVAIVSGVLFEHSYRLVIKFKPFEALHDFATICGILVSGNSHQPEVWTMRIAVTLVFFISWATLFFILRYLSHATKREKQERAS
jgi:hypothetical protein